MKLGAFIAKGARREVYEHPTNKDWVIKKLREDKLKRNKERYTDSNVREYSTWELASSINQANLLVPCIEISEDKKYLVQLKGKSLKKKSEIPKDMYEWMKSDALSARQWVRVNGQILLCDYDCSQLKKLQEQLN